MLAMLPCLKITPPHQVSSYLTLRKKRISNVFVKGIFAYLLMAPLKVDTYYYVLTSITGSFSFNFQKLLRVNERPKAKEKNVSMFHNYPKLCTFSGVRPFDVLQINNTKKK
jgi:hypothetical protein